MCCVQISHISAAEKWHFGGVVSLTKKLQFFSGPFWLPLTKLRKVSTEEATHLSPPHYVKIHPHQFRIAGLFTNHFRTITISAQAALKLASAYKYTLAD